MTGDTGIQEQSIVDRGAVARVNALAIISHELKETIRNAHLALEDCVDGRGGSAALVRAGELLHQARGALQLSETYGAKICKSRHSEPRLCDPQRRDDVPLYGLG